MSYYDWAPYVSVAQKRRNAASEVAKLRKKGQSVEPVFIEGRKIAASFWGKAWCDNLERYSDYSNRLPRGRSYVRNGAVANIGTAARQPVLIIAVMLQVRAPRLPPEALGNGPALDRDGGNRLSLLPQLGQLSLSTPPLLSHRHIRSPCEVAHPSDLLHRRT